MNIKMLKDLVEVTKVVRKEIALADGLYLAYVKTVTVNEDGTLTWAGYQTDITSVEEPNWVPIEHTETKFCGRIKDMIKQATDTEYYQAVQDDIAQHGYDNRQFFCSFQTGTVEHINAYMLINVATTTKNGVTYKNVNYSSTKCAQLLAVHETTQALLNVGIITAETAPEEVDTIVTSIKEGNCNPLWAQHFVYIPHSAAEGMQDFYKKACGVPTAKSIRKEVK